MLCETRRRRCVDGRCEYSEPDCEQKQGRREFWSAEQTSATRASERSDVAGNYADQNGDNAGGITNRSYDEEVDNQESLPDRGMSREESRNREVDSESEMDRESRRSER